MPNRRGRSLRPVFAAVVLCTIFYCFDFAISGPYDSEPRLPFEEHPAHAQALFNTLNLTQEKCESVFPGLTQSVDDIVAEGPFHLKNIGDTGPLQGRIRDGKIYIVNAQRRADLSTDMINSRTAALHQLHRALLTSPEPLPDTVFAINIQDQPFGTAWGYSRAASEAHRSKEPDERTFLMPHFSFWAWKLPFVGSLTRAAAAIDRLEREIYPRGLRDKIPRAVWRGTAWFNSVHSPQLRQKLLAATRGKPWADVEALQWTGSSSSSSSSGGLGGRNASNALPIEDFCRYRYVVYTEGITYSGRFQFLQMCASVTITPPIQWLQHTTHLVKPVFSRDLRSSRLVERSRRRGAKAWPSSNESARRGWPTAYAADVANIVFVAPDWSDLETTIKWLEEHPVVAQGIARRQRDLFAGGGYFSPAAEVCYWRALVRGWSSVVHVDKGAWGDGVPYETFSLSNGE